MKDNRIIKLQSIWIFFLSLFILVMYYICMVKLNLFHSDFLLYALSTILFVPSSIYGIYKFSFILTIDENKIKIKRLFGLVSDVEYICTNNIKEFKISTIYTGDAGDFKIKFKDGKSVDLFIGQSHFYKAIEFFRTNYPDVYVND